MGHFFSYIYKNNDCKIKSFNKFDKNEYYQEYINQAENLINIFNNTHLNLSLDKIEKYNKLNNIYYRYDMLICKLNTEFNRDSDKMKVELLNNHTHVLEYLYKLRTDKMDDIIINFI